MNVALYGPHGKRWALTERGRTRLARDAGRLEIGPSALLWDGSALTARLDEVTVPLPSRIRGRVRVHPGPWFQEVRTLDAAGRHRWWPMAPCARVEVALERPALRWSGRAYLDSNWGEAPLEDAFVRWDWSRSALPDGGSAVLYDVARRDGAEGVLAMHFDPAGRWRDFAPPPRVALPPTGWRIARGTRTDPGAPARVRRTLEDTPFYARSLLASSLLGQPGDAVHESLSLDRFRRASVQALLPFRMPRRP